MSQAACLLVLAGSHQCAIPLGAVVETMRPLPTERLPGMSSLLIGLSLVRGAVVPVVDLAALFDDRGVVCRYILSRTGARRLVLAVSTVVGLVQLDAMREAGEAIAEKAASPCVAAIAAHGGRSVTVIDVARVLPEAALRAIDCAGASDHG